MSKNELEKLWDYEIDIPYRQKIEDFQQILIDIHNEDSEIDGVGDVEVNEGGKKVLYPSWTKYKHYFSDGLYVREMFCPKGYLACTVIHNTANPLFMMKGTMAVSSEEGVQQLVAPSFIFSKPGTKRVCYFIEDTICVTVHPNPDGLTDLDEIEKKMFSCTWDEYDKQEFKEDVWSAVDHKKYQKKIKKENMKKINKTS